MVLSDIMSVDVSFFPHSSGLCERIVVFCCANQKEMTNLDVGQSNEAYLRLLGFFNCVTARKGRRECYKTLKILQILYPELKV